MGAVVFPGWTTSGLDSFTPLFWRRSKLDPEGQRLIPRNDQQRLLQHLELGDLPSWSALQRNSGWHRVAIDHWHPQATPDWLWSVGLPLLNLGQQWQGQRRLLGFSALPGCGKTTLGQWIEAAATALGLSIQVVSLDDFYFEADRLDAAMPRCCCFCSDFSSAATSPFTSPMRLGSEHSLPCTPSSPVS